MIHHTYRLEIVILPVTYTAILGYVVTQRINNCVEISYGKLHFELNHVHSLLCRNYSSDMYSASHQEAG